MTTSTGSGDIIFLHGLTVECTIGFIDWERLVKQTVVLDLESRRHPPVELDARLLRPYGERLPQVEDHRLGQRSAFSS